MQCLGSWLFEVHYCSSAALDAGMQPEYSRFYTMSTGNPAIMGEIPADRWLCVPFFRTVCLSASKARMPMQTVNLKQLDPKR